MKYHRHPVVYRLHQFIRACGDDRIGLQRLPGGLVLPFVPQASECEEFSVLHGDGIRLLALRIQYLPFIKPIGWNQTTTMLRCLTIGRTRSDGLRLGIDSVKPSWNPLPKTEPDPIA